MSKGRLVGLGIGIALIVAAFGLVMWQAANLPATQTAFAQGATATPSANATAVPQQNQSQPQQQAIGDTFWGILAGKLGVNADDLKSKALDARKEMLDQAVKDGRITQAQADGLKQSLTSNNLIAPIPLPRGNPVPNNNQPNQNPGRRGPFGGFGNRGPGPVIGPGFGGFGFGHGMIGAGLDMLNAVAGALKLEPKALIEQLSQGKTLADIAKAQGLDEATVKQAIIDFRTKQIDQLLSLGVISEVQANGMKSKLTPDNIDLSRGFRFNFNTSPSQQQQGQSQVLPDFGTGQMFGIMPGNGDFNFRFTVPDGNVQTQ